MTRFGQRDASQRAYMLVLVLLLFLGACAGPKVKSRMAAEEESYVAQWSLSPLLAACQPPDVGGGRRPGSYRHQPVPQPMKYA